MDGKESGSTEEGEKIMSKERRESEKRERTKKGS